ncbi:MAG: hypothetical protein PHO23_03395 [Candidatus Pacebacteria bacterium]|nr:hypothetical protein [Candidatus Paceibacterota bacterium]
MFNKTRKVMTKTGKQMAFSNLNDGAFGVDVVIFPKTYEMLRQKANVHDIVDNKITLVEGRIDVRNNKPQIICEDVIYLN